MVSSEPRRPQIAGQFSLNWTPATATLSAAVALRVTGEDVRLEPPAGAVMLMVGGVVSGGVPPTGVVESLAILEAVRAILYIRTSSMTPLVKSESPPKCPIYKGLELIAGVTV